MCRIAALLAIAAGCADRGSADNGDMAGYEVVARYPHDTAAYTQGLDFHEGVLYESTGQIGRSSIRRVELKTGRILAQRALQGEHFGEGAVILGDRLYQLTWTSGVGFIYSIPDLAVIDSFHYEGEGWGLATDGRALVMSDGTERIRYLDPTSFEVIHSFNVTDRGAPLRQLNELEWINGELWANVYQTDYVVRIDPGTGLVRQWIDFSGLIPLAAREQADVLNGIAYDSAGSRIFVTGKLWPQLFEVRITEP